MSSRILRKKRVFVGATVATLALAGVAFAAFTSEGKGSGYAEVGKAASWEVTLATPSGGPLFPGSGTDTLVYYVRNNSAGNITLKSVTVKLKESNKNVISEAARPAPRLRRSPNNPKARR